MAPTKYFPFFAFLFATMSWASSPVAMMWREVAFTTDRGDKVSMTMHDDKLEKVVVVLHQKRIVLPNSALLGVNLPVFSRSDLLYSSGLDGNRKFQSAILRIPTLDPVLDVQEEGEPKRNFSFIFRDGRLEERLLEVRVGTVWQVIETKIL